MIVFVLVVKLIAVSGSNQRNEFEKPFKYFFILPAKKLELNIRHVSLIKRENFYYGFTPMLVIAWQYSPRRPLCASMYARPSSNLKRK